MENINTIGRTITGLSDAEYFMIIRALKARAIHFNEKATNAKTEFDRYEDIEISKSYRELAKFIEDQNN